MIQMPRLVARAGNEEEWRACLSSGFGARNGLQKRTGSDVMGPVRRIGEHEAEFRARQARYSLKWFVVLLAIAAGVVPVAYVGRWPIPVAIVAGIVLLLGLGMSGLATLSAVLAHWQAQRTPSARERRALKVIGLIMGVLVLLCVQLVFLLDLWIALQTGEITWHRRHGPSTTYVFQTQPTEFLLHFGFEAALSLSVPGVLLSVWRMKRRSASPGSPRPDR